ncbi:MULTISPECIES: response regulator transcription factor [unclassified Paenibacillus]|uniref:response regulator transcription factor n=1 Tax=unclassified Paenibacillus TaxID=185978 RepID=UPI001C107917|nr:MULTISPECIES: response regulator transcription factor [unclassified Paenibacillus]MBU5440582.1 response regulator transcription factor [Paenibacillus sp. MSJ-34]CAH0120048.1 Transcriptional regulatory protein LnrK [Paenibacillus sp. CECT 9249]
MIRVLIVDDDAFIRESLKMIFEYHPAIEVAGVCGNGREAFEFVRERPDVEVVLMDIRMPECDGVEGTRLIKSVAPHIAVLILTTFDDDDYIVEAIRNGAGGYLLKNIAPERIVEGIQTVHKGDLLIHPDVARKLAGLIGDARKRPSRPASGPNLESYGITPTERQIIALIAEGQSNREIAQSLFLSEGTVKNYISDILSKLQLRDRTQIAIFYLKQSQN